MPRQRKDGTAPRGAVRVGRLRFADNGKEWRVRAYAPTPSAPRGRVTHVPAGGTRPTGFVPKQGQTLDELFEQVERYYDYQVAISSQKDKRSDAARTIARLGDLYLEQLRAKGRDPEYIRNRACLVRKWIVPEIGDVLVEDWSPSHCEQVLANGRGHVGRTRVEDIGSTLSGMRAVAHEKRPGGRWLDPTDNPLEGVSYTGKGRYQDRPASYVPANMRPSRDNVTKAIVAAGEVGRWTWMPDICSVASLNAARLGEQLALRAVDVDFANLLLDINGAWKVQSSEVKGGPRRRWRQPWTKNGLRRTTPLYGSQVPSLFALCRIALRLAEDATLEDVVAAIETERSRREELSPTGDWRDFQVDDLRDEQWLFPDDSGLPPSKESFNDAWHKVRDASEWSARIPYKNMRHYAILNWYALVDEDGQRCFEFVDIAPWSGHDEDTLRKYYILPSEATAKKARAVLGAM